MHRATFSILTTLLVLQAMPSFAQQSVIETQAMRIRTTQGKQVIKCSPDGGGEWFPPMTALQKIKRGDVLRLAPGLYPAALTIDVDNIIIEGDPERDLGGATVSIKMNANDCSIRSLRVQHLDLSNSCNIVDSVVSFVYFYPNREQRKKYKMFFANSIIGRTSFYSGDCDLQMDFYRCTLYNNGKDPSSDSALIDMNGKTNLSLEKCVLYGSKCLVIDGDWGGKVRMSIDTSLLFGIDSIAREETDYGKGRSKGSTDVARTLKDIRKVCAGTVNIKGQCLVEKPQFTEDIFFTSICHASSGLRGGYSYYTSSSRAPTLNFSGLALKPGTPGADLGIGVSFNEKKFPGVSAAEVASATSGKKAAPPAPTPSAPKAPEKKEVVKSPESKPERKSAGESSDDKELMDVIK